MPKLIQIPKSIKGILHATIYETGKPPQTTPIVILCHGFTGDQTEWGRFEKTAKVLNQHGYDALLFDFSGSGKNLREPVTLSKQSRDLEDVIIYIKNANYQKLNILGLSFGGLTTLVTPLPKVTTLIFWAPGFYLPRLIPKFHKFMAKVAYKLRRPPMKRKSINNDPILMDYTFLFDEKMDQTTKFMKKMEIPTLIIHGNEDKQIPLTFTAEAFQHLPDTLDKSRIVIEGAGHDFKDDHLDLFIDHSLKWLDTYN